MRFYKHLFLLLFFLVGIIHIQLLTKDVYQLSDVPIREVIKDHFPAINFSYLKDGRIKITNEKLNLTFLPNGNFILVNDKLFRLTKPISFNGSEYSIGYLDQYKFISFLDDLLSVENKVSEYKVYKEDSRDERIVVVIDPGHGGAFTGTTGISGVKEKVLNLDIALKIKSILGKKFRVILTREVDTELDIILKRDLQRRVDISAMNSADLFISIHCNSNRNFEIHGFEIYIPRYVDWLNKREKLMSSPYASRILAKYNLTKENYIMLMWNRTYRIATLIKKNLEKVGVKSRGIRVENLHVLRENITPAVLVEVEYLSNPYSEALLLNDTFREKIARAISEAVITMFNEEKLRP